METASPGEADPESTFNTTTNNYPTTEHKIYSGDELELSPPPPVLDKRKCKDVPLLSKIGEGSDATVFEVIGESAVLKKYHKNNGKNHSHEPRNTVDIVKGFADYQPRYGIPVKIPEILDIPGECPEYWDQYWYDYEYMIPWIYIHSHSTPASKMSLMRSVPTIVRRALISHYHPRGPAPMDPYIVDEILHREENRHCLIHPNLGSEKIERPRGEFTLQNFELSLKEMEEMGMDLENLAATLGDTLAFFNFNCRYRTLGTKFALGAAPVDSETPNGPLAICAYLFEFEYTDKIGPGQHHWLLRNRAEDLPYYIPNCRRTPHLWAIFKTAYIKQGNECRPASFKITPEEVMKDYEELVARMAS
ncbi:hypothetical protein ACHAPJ_008417 [Fusarium lateritium]